MTYTESNVRSAIESLIQTAAPNAVVFPWWVLGYQRDVWPGLLRSDADGGKGFLRGIANLGNMAVRLYADTAEAREGHAAFKEKRPARFRPP